MTTGLDGIVAAETVMSLVDGQRGVLVIRGLPIEEAARTLDFEGVLALLWDGFADTADLKPRLGAARTAAFRHVSRLLPGAAGLPPIDGLRAMIAGLADDQDGTPLGLVAAMPVFLAALVRQAQGKAPVAPDPKAGHAADLLRMLADRPADPALARALDAYLVTVSDHGLNASTFAARVVASTLAGTVASVTAALCALKGPLHGGAPGPVLDMLDAIGTAQAAPGWIEAELVAGRRLMGFGHRIYRTRDPRADVLKSVVARLSSPRIALAEAVEKAALAALHKHKPDRPLDINVEFYTALVLDAVGLDRSLFTPAFAIGRVAGWTAHILEQEQTGRLLRPDSRYVGPAPSLAA
ncbi:citrate synthase/methylcitrate synthase [Inquilinus sp. YAF38]|uniref:citrate synthase/methylcitrate synthase n=1 Tax=Inquilinus sp. YAF38 TaxID=3233084 RepID=UPI003F90D262